MLTRLNRFRLEDRIAALDKYRQQVAACTLCQELAGTRTQTVFGVGSPNARVCYFGEAPGADEDRQGEPFVGRAGQLLTKIIQATKMSREDVYILNTLKCRPPGNRNPLPDELSHCRPFFEAQLEIVQPRIHRLSGIVRGSVTAEHDAINWQNARPLSSLFG